MTAAHIVAKSYPAPIASLAMHRNSSLMNINPSSEYLIRFQWRYTAFLCSTITFFPLEHKIPTAISHKV